MTKTIPPPTIRAPAPMVMSLMRLKTTGRRLGRRAAGICTSTLAKNPSWRPNSSSPSLMAATGLRTTSTGEAMFSALELLRDDGEVEGGHHEVGEEDEDERDDDALVDGVAHAFGAAL